MTTHARTGKWSLKLIVRKIYHHHSAKCTECMAEIEYFFRSIGPEGLYLRLFAIYISELNINRTSEWRMLCLQERTKDNHAEVQRRRIFVELK